jgi:hypothetical protein
MLLKTHHADLLTWPKTIFLVREKKTTEFQKIPLCHCLQIFSFHLKIRFFWQDALPGGGGGPIHIKASRVLTLLVVHDSSDDVLLRTNAMSPQLVFTVYLPEQPVRHIFLSFHYGKKSCHPRPSRPAKLGKTSVRSGTLQSL